MMSSATGAHRAAPPADPHDALLRHALRVEYLTGGWNVAQGVVAVATAATAGSVALLGFG
jgi:hypothetical protein